MIRYTEKRLLGFSQKQMYQIVSQVHHYQEFVPWVQKSTILSQSPLRAELTVGFQQFTASYTSQVHLNPPSQIKAVAQSQLFNSLVNTWDFTPCNDTSCLVQFAVAFEFRSLIHSQLSQVFLDQVAKTMVSAFEKRAEKLYGKPSLKSVTF